MSAKIISLADMQRLLQGGKKFTVFDVRTPPEFAKVHVQGAQSMPLDKLDPAAISAGRSAPDDPVYVICQTGGRAARACAQLEAAGIVPVYSIEGGTAAWERAGMPVERGQSHVISLERQVRIAAGALVLLGLLLARIVHPMFWVIPAFVGAGLMFAGITDYCGMGLLLCKMPWNRAQ